MKNFTRKVFLTRESISLIDKDINAKDSYTVFSNKEEGTIEVDITISIPESFNVSEDVLMDIIAGLCPSESEEQHQAKLKLVLQHLRSIGASLWFTKIN